MLKNVIFCSLFLFLLTGCDVKPDTCREQSDWTMKVFFYKVDTAGGHRTVSDSTLSRIVIMREGLTLLDTTGFKKVSFVPLQSADTTKYTIALNNRSSVTFYAVYKRERIFENYKCGFRTNFFLDTLYTIPRVCDSIIIVNPNITDVYKENCRFYLNNDSTKYL